MHALVARWFVSVEEAAYSCFLYGVGLDWRRGDMSGKVRGSGDG